MSIFWRNKKEVRKAMKIIKKDNQRSTMGKSLSNEDFIHCTKCGRKILRTDNYCMYCGTPTEIKPF